MGALYLPVTTTTAVALTVWILILTQRIVARRHEAKVSLGDGEDRVLQRRVRAHANLIEYAPMFVILIGVTELQNGNTYLLTILSAVFLAGRILHGYTLAFTSQSSSGPARVYGMAATLLSLGGAALYALVNLIV